MRSVFTKTSIARTAAAAAFVIALPVAGALAARHHTTAPDEAVTATYHGSRLASIMTDLQGLDQGIRDGVQQKLLNATTERSLRMQAAEISRDAERVARSNGGRIPDDQYHQILGQLDNLNQSLLSDTGSGFLMGDGSDGGHYPNG